jgi:hypothetical protein
MAEDGIGCMWCFFGVFENTVAQNTGLFPTAKVKFEYFCLAKWLSTDMWSSVITGNPGEGLGYTACGTEDI